MKVTIDSSDPLEKALAVLGAMYGVTLAVSVAGSADAPGARTRTTRRSPGVARKATRGSRGRKSTSSSRAAAAGPARATSVSNAELRSWARQHGYAVADRGRMPREVVMAYQAAQQG